MSMRRPRRDVDAVACFKHVGARGELDLEAPGEDGADMAALAPMRRHVGAILDPAQQLLGAAVNLLANAGTARLPRQLIERDAIRHVSPYHIPSRIGPDVRPFAPRRDRARQMA